MVDFTAYCTHLQGIFSHELRWCNSEQNLELLQLFCNVPCVCRSIISDMGLHSRQLAACHWFDVLATKVS